MKAYYTKDGKKIHVSLEKIEETRSLVHYTGTDIRKWVHNKYLIPIDDEGTGLNKEERMRILAVGVFLIGLIWMVFQCLK